MLASKRYISDCKTSQRIHTLKEMATCNLDPCVNPEELGRVLNLECVKSLKE